ncbi:MAG: ChbG/HpnK family deacetylase [Dethiobacteria bacterium]
MSRQDFWDKMGLAGERVLIMHHDDLGFLYSQDAAFHKLGFKTGSLMMPGTWVTGFLGLKDVDLGVHLTLTSEWDAPRLRPLTDGPSLRDAHGYLWPTLEEAWVNITLEDAMAEMKAQVESAYRLGIDVTHLDTHMGTVLRPDLAEVYVQLGRDYRLPVYLPASVAEHGIDEPACSFFDEMLGKIEMPKYRLVDGYRVPPPQRKDWYLEKLSGLEPGVYHLIHHSAVPETDLVLPDRAVRTADFEALIDPQVREVIGEFRMLSYREIRDKLREEPPERN